MNRERLKKLIEILQNPGKMQGVGVFNMNFFHADIKDCYDPAGILSGFCVNHSCNTVACALGAAASHPWFINRGLTIDPRAKFNNVIYKSYRGYDAAAVFFGISYKKSLNLFNPQEYKFLADKITPAIVANRIQSLLNKDK